MYRYNLMEDVAIVTYVTGFNRGWVIFSCEFARRVITHIETRVFLKFQDSLSLMGLGVFSGFGFSLERREQTCLYPKSIVRHPPYSKIRPLVVLFSP